MGGTEPSTLNSTGTSVEKDAKLGAEPASRFMLEETKIFEHPEPKAFFKKYTV